MKYTVFNEPPARKTVAYSDWQVEYTGSACAAALLTFFSLGHLRRMSQGKSLLQGYTEVELLDAMMGGFGRPAIRSAIKELTRLGAISIHRNPDPRCSHDQTKHFLLHPETVNEWLASNSTSRLEVES